MGSTTGTTTVANICGHTIHVEGRGEVTCTKAPHVIPTYHQNGDLEWAFIESDHGFGSPNRCTAGLVTTTDEPGEVGMGLTGGGVWIPAGARSKFKYFNRCDKDKGHEGDHQSADATRVLISIMNSGRNPQVVRTATWRQPVSDGVLPAQ